MPTQTRKGPEKKREGTELQVACSTCNRETTHSVVRSAEYVSEYEDGNFSITSWDEYQIVECEGCKTLSFRHCGWNTEDSVFDPDGYEEPNERVVIYPHRLSGHSQVRDTHLLPLSIQKAYEETLQALSAGMTVLAGIGIRAIVETVCRDRGAKGRNLEAKIDNLVAQGVLTSHGSEILHSLRIMGNDAAHEVKPQTVADLTTALDVIEHTLQGLYILPKHAANLPKRTKGAPKKLR